MTVDTEPHAHFEELRSRINERLVELDTDCCEQQIHCFPWLYGALGNPESEVVFICENPSLAGVEDAHKNTVDGGPPGIEDQWWGGLAKRFRAKLFRAVLCELGLKDGKIDERVGWRGWHCYITNVVKEMNKTKDQNAMQQRAKGPQARDWAAILKWQLATVNPKAVFCVGEKADAAVRKLQRGGLLPEFRCHKITHYSARYSKERVIAEMREGISGPLQEIGWRPTK